MDISTYIAFLYLSLVIGDPSDRRFEWSRVMIIIVNSMYEPCVVLYDWGEHKGGQGLDKGVQKTVPVIVVARVWRPSRYRHVRASARGARTDGLFSSRCYTCAELFPLAAGAAATPATARANSWCCWQWQWQPAAAAPGSSPTAARHRHSTWTRNLARSRPPRPAPRGLSGAP